MMAITKKRPDAGFSAIGRGGSFISGMMKGEPLLEVARSGLSSIGVGEADQERYAGRIARYGTAEDAASLLSLGTITSERSQELLAEKALAAFTPFQACKLIIDGNISSSAAQELVLDKVPLTAELAYGVFRSGRVNSENGQKSLAHTLFEHSTRPDNVFRQIGGRISHKLLEGGYVTAPIAQEMLCGVILHSSDRDPEVQAKAVALLAKGTLSEDAQSLLSMLVSDPDAAKALLSLGVVTSKIAKSRLYEKTPREERDTILAPGPESGASGVRFSGKGEASG